MGPENYGGSISKFVIAEVKRARDEGKAVELAPGGLPSSKTIIFNDTAESVAVYVNQSSPGQRLDRQP